MIKFDTENTEIYKRYINNVLPLLGEHDITLVSALVNEIRELGIDIDYIFQISWLEKDEIIKCNSVIISYIDRFDYLPLSFGLISNLGKRGNKEVTQFMMEEFKKPNIYKRDYQFDQMSDYEKDIAWASSRRWVVSNALLEIRDKSCIDGYIELIENESTRCDTMLIIDLLGKLRCQKSFECIKELLVDENPRIVVAAVKALKNYKSYCEVGELLTPLVNHENEIVRTTVIKCIKQVKNRKE